MKSMSPKSSYKRGFGTLWINAGAYQKNFTRLVKLHFPPHTGVPVGKFLSKVPKRG